MQLSLPLISLPHKSYSYFRMTDGKIIEPFVVIFEVESFFWHLFDYSAHEMHNFKGICMLPLYFHVMLHLFIKNEAMLPIHY